MRMTSEIRPTCYVAHLNAEQRTNNANLHTTYDCGHACICNIRKRGVKPEAQNGMPKSPNASQEIDSKQNVAKEFVEPWWVPDGEG